MRQRKTIQKILGNIPSKLKPILFIAAFAMIGTAALIFTMAATPTASVEPENGTVAGAACTHPDATASGGDAIKFGTACSGPGLPAGVTLQDIDGGQAYYEQWANSFPSAQEDPTFFPIAIFNNYDIASKAVPYKNMGINTFVGLYNGGLSGSPPELTVAKNNGMYALIGPEASANTISSYGSTAAGYIYQDEAENNTCSKIDVSWLQAYCTNSNGKVSTASFISMTNQMHIFDSTRPVYNGFTNGFVFDWFLSGNAAQLAQGSDIIGYDVYPLVDRRSTFGGQMTTGKVWGTYETVKLSRGYAGNAKPIWPDIETSQVDTFNNTCYRPSGADVKALVWNGIIAGARGITYFNANFASNCASPTMGTDVLLNASFSDIRTAVTEVNARVKAHAPEINAKFANGYETHTGNVNTMVKYYNNQFYIFASPKASGSQSITFTLAGAPSGTVTVLDENRTIPLTGGAFTDTFANDNTIHIYKVN
jgi:hypothetical protein